jgi:3-deoxy-7-phosphoheptulonate synthase
MIQDWTFTSWKGKNIHQAVEYEDDVALQRSLHKLKILPPLVSHIEVDRLRKQLAYCANGDRFLLQGGDCAELFDYCSANPIESKIKVLLQMSLILVWGKVKPVRIARMAGQYAKPRSKPTGLLTFITNS